MHYLVWGGCGGRDKGGYAGVVVGVVQYEGDTKGLESEEFVSIICTSCIPDVHAVLAAVF